MGQVSLDDIIVTPLKKIPTGGGDVFHAIKNSDNGFNGFGEVYFWILAGSPRHQDCECATRKEIQGFCKPS